MVAVLLWNNSFCFDESLRFCSRTLQEDRVLHHHLSISCRAWSPHTWLGKPACRLTRGRWGFKVFVKTNLWIFYATDSCGSISCLSERDKGVSMCWSPSFQNACKIPNRVRFNFFSPRKNKLVIVKSLLGLVLVSWYQLTARGPGCHPSPHGRENQYGWVITGNVQHSWFKAFCGSVFPWEYILS